MRVTMVTPHLPPEQSANAILPDQLGPALAPLGVEVSYVAHPPRHASGVPARPEVRYAPRRGSGRLARTPLGALVAAGRIAAKASEAIAGCDLVHLQGNGLIVEVADRLAQRYAKPCVITLFGTDIWHHDSRRHRLYGAVVRRAAARVFYSQELLAFGRGVDLAPDPSEVIYAPVAAAFRDPGADARRTLRDELGFDQAPVLLTVKRLHPVGGQEDLLRALPGICKAFPATQLVLIGEGERRPGLEALARELGLTARVRFLGAVPNAELWRYYAAADLFVLPSRLESWGTVMLEALACGTPVVATETAGGREVARHFPDDVRLTPPEQPERLAEAVVAAAAAPRRSSQAARERLRHDFSVETCARRYLQTYRRALEL